MSNVEVLLHLGVDLVGQTQTAVVHRQQEALDHERGIEAVLHQADGVEQFADALQREVFALHGDDDAVGRRESVHRDDAQRGAAVDDDEVVVAANFGEHLGHHPFALLHVEQLDLGTHQIDVAGQDVEVFEVGGVDGLTDVGFAHKHLVDAAVEL